MRIERVPQWLLWTLLVLLVIIDAYCFYRGRVALRIGLANVADVWGRWEGITMEAAAAWAAAAIAAWVATAQMRDNRQQLRREAIAELDVRSTEWGIAAGAMLGGIRRYLNGTGASAELQGPLISGLSTATANLNRALRVAEMVCPHTQIHTELGAMQSSLGEFMSLIGSSEPVDAEQQRAILERAFDEGQDVMMRLVEQSVAVVCVGMKRYSIRTWGPKRLLDRTVTIEGRNQADPPKITR